MRLSPFSSTMIEASPVGCRRSCLMKRTSMWLSTYSSLSRFACVSLPSRQQNMQSPPSRSQDGGVGSFAARDVIVRPAFYNSLSGFGKFLHLHHKVHIRAADYKYSFFHVILLLRSKSLLSIYLIRRLYKCVTVRFLWGRRLLKKAPPRHLGELARLSADPTPRKL